VVQWCGELKQYCGGTVLWWIEPILRWWSVAVDESILRWCSVVVEWSNVAVVQYCGGYILWQGIARVP